MPSPLVATSSPVESASRRRCRRRRPTSRRIRCDERRSARKRGRRPPGPSGERLMPTVRTANRRAAPTCRCRHRMRRPKRRPRQPGRNRRRTRERWWSIRGLMEVGLVHLGPGVRAHVVRPRLHSCLSVACGWDEGDDSTRLVVHGHRGEATLRWAGLFRRPGAGLDPNLRDMSLRAPELSQRLWRGCPHPPRRRRVAPRSPVAFPPGPAARLSLPRQSRQHPSGT